MNIICKIVNGLHIKLHLPDNFSGKTIVYVHGGPGSNSIDFEYGLEKFPDLTASGIAWITYDQRGCGRSLIAQTSLNHRTNIDDLKDLLSIIPSQFGELGIVSLYGHSYGARLVYDLLYTNPQLQISAIVAGRSIHPLDAMNTSILMDIMILREKNQAGFRKACRLLSQHDGEPYELAKYIRELFTENENRQLERQKFYWINEEAMNWWNEVQKQLKYSDSDEIYFQVAGSYQDEDFNSGLFDPSLLSQPCILIQGFFDVLMNGPAAPRLKNSKNAYKLNGSAHYPHFEQPIEFMEVIRKFLVGVEKK